MTEWPPSWATVPLGDAATWSSGGTPRTGVAEYWDGPIPWISSGSLTEWKLTTSDRTLTEAGAANGSRMVPEGTTIFVVRGMSLKSEFRIGIAMKPMAFGQDCKALRARDGLDDLFLAYAIKAQTARILDLVDEAGHGTGRLNTDQMKELVIGIPPPDEQREIVGVLSALDDKIDANRRTAALIRAVAQTEFTRWRSELMDWDETTFGEFCSVYGGSTPRTTEPSYWGGPHAWATPTDVTGLIDPYLFATGRTITDAGLASSSTELHPPGSIFMTSRATIGAFAINQVACAANQGFIVVRPMDLRDRWFLFHEMQHRLPDMLDLANGSTFLEISRGVFKTMFLGVPTDRSVLLQLDSVLALLHARACSAAAETRTLEALRDALMPELLSGRLRVPCAVTSMDAVT